MNVLFVATYKGHKYRKGKPAISNFLSNPGISSIASVLKQAGHKVRLLVVCGNTPSAVIDQTVTEFKPKLVGFTSVYSEYDFVKQIAQEIRRKWPELSLIAGGVHVTLNPDKTIKDSWDAICVGEGEYPMLDLVNRLEAEEPWNNIDNLWCKTDAGIKRNKSRPFIEDLSTLPYPDREMWEPWVKPKPKQATILLGRGCPFQCTYCCNHALRKLAPGKYVRIRSAEHVLGEVTDLLKKYPFLESIRFEIETMGVHSEIVIDIAERLNALNQTREKPLSFDINLRIVPRHDFGPLLHALKKANFNRVDIGLESGSESVRKKYLKRNYSNNDVRNATAAIREAGLAVSMYVLVGIPGERFEDYLETEALLRELQPEGLSSYIVFPYPGTAMYRAAKEQGLISETPDFRSERARPTMDLPTFPAKKIQNAFDWLPYNVYRGHRPRLFLLLWVLYRKACRWGLFGFEHYG